ncbi:MAG: hypothetical protein ABIE23_05070 [archaeon]
MAMENILSDTGNALIQALYSLWDTFVLTIPGLLAAIVLIIIGWIIGKVLKEVVVRIIRIAKIDEWVEEHKLSAVIGHVPISAIAGTIVKWYVIVLFLAQAVAFIQLKVLENFLTYLWVFIPRVLAAFAFIVMGFLLARYVRNMVEKTAHTHKAIFGLVIEIVIMYVAVVLALMNMGFDVTILLDAFRIALTAFVVIFALIIGIAFAVAFKKDILGFATDIKKQVK